MALPTARFADAEGAQVIVTDEAGSRFVPVTMTNADFLALLAAGVAIAPYLAPALTAAAVLAEYQRRLIALLEARDLAHAAFIRADDADETAALAGLASRSAEQQARLDELLARRAAINLLIDRYNVLDALQPVPADFAADARWVSAVAEWATEAPGESAVAEWATEAQGGERGRGVGNRSARGRARLRSGQPKRQKAPPLRGDRPVWYARLHWPSRPAGLTGGLHRNLPEQQKGCLPP